MPVKNYRHEIRTRCCGRVSIASTGTATESLPQCSDPWTEENYFCDVWFDLYSQVVRYYESISEVLRIRSVPSAHGLRDRGALLVLVHLPEIVAADLVALGASLLFQFLFITCILYACLY